MKLVSEVLYDIDPDIELASWEDGVMSIEDQTPFPITNFKQDVYTNAWQNIWEWGNGDRAYKLANADYKV